MYNFPCMNNISKCSVTNSLFSDSSDMSILKTGLKLTLLTL